MRMGWRRVQLNVRAGRAVLSAGFREMVGRNMEGRGVSVEESRLVAMRQGLPPPTHPDPARPIAACRLRDDVSATEYKTRRQSRLYRLTSRTG